MMHVDYLKSIKRKLFLKYVMVVSGITLGGIGIIYLFDDVLNGVVIDFIRLFSTDDAYATFRSIYAIALPAVIVSTGFVVIYYLCKDLANIMNLIMKGMEDVMMNGRHKIRLPKELKNCENHILEVAGEYQNYLDAALEDEEKKKDLIYLLARDIKMPLSNIIMYLEFISKEERISQEIRKDYIVKILYQSFDLEDIINEFFDITRFNLQYAKWSPDHMYLDRMVEQVIDEYYPFIEEKGMDVELKRPTQLALYADNEKIARVLRDLLRNLVALGKVESTIGIYVSEDESTYRIHMSAHAPHLSAYQITHIFHNYYRLKDVLGVGTSHVLGLGIAKQIMDMQKGELRASSIADNLSFYVTIPKQIYQEKG